MGERAREAARLRAEGERRRLEEAWKSSGVGRRFLPARLANYETPSPAHRAAAAACREAVEAFAEGNGLLLAGEPGGGKTHLLCGMLFEALERGLSVRYLAAEDFYLGLRSRMDEGLSESGYIDRLASADVLALDDLYCLAAAKSAHDESYQYRMLWILLDRRYREARATVAGTNRPLKDFREMLDERTRRRLEAKVVRVPKRIPK
ncbi:MAG: ATP-binding protein [Planctomycetota bacterium]|jgi:DNA replication protein DnaC|nr:ATP-binding protein [Planctomycetota bacterium]